MKFNFYLLFSILLMLGSLNSFAQIGIGTKTPASSAALEVTSSTNNKGILIPRITATQKDAIASPAEGLLVYQTTAPIGFYYYTAGTWKLMAIQSDLASKVDKVDGKNLSTNDYTTAEKTKLSAITGSNTGDQTTITGNAGTATKLATARNINGVAFDGSSDITITAAADAGALTGTTLKSTVTGSSLTSVGTLANLTVTNPIAGSLTGNAGTATKLAATKNINGVAFDGSSDITIAAAAAAETLTGTALKSTVTGSSLTSVGTLGNLTVTNPIAGSVTGNAGTATKLAASKNINGVAFDGSADITITAAADAEQLAGTTLKSTVTGSSLTSVGTLGNLTVTNPIAGSVTGNAATATTATTAGNITATSNNTLTSLSNLATVGTINSGVWSGTAVAVEKGGTGATTASAARTNLGLANVDNTSDLNKQISTATQAELNSKLNLIDTASMLLNYKNRINLKLNTTDTTAMLSSYLRKSGTWSGTTIAIAKGGTGATTKSAGFDALSPMTTSGDIIYGGTSGTGTRLGKGSDGQVLTLASGIPSWASLSGVPYTGATGAVNLGGYDLTVNELTVGRGGGGKNSNVAIGINALRVNHPDAAENTAIGYAALISQNSSSARANTATGFQSLEYNLSGQENSAFGHNALKTNNASYNTAIGSNALSSNTTGLNNTAIGYAADVSANNLSNATAIGNGAIVAASNTIQLGNTAVTNVKTSGTITAGAVTYPKVDGTAGQVLTANANGIPTWSSSSYTLPTASSLTLGGIKVGTGLTADSFGALSVNLASPTFTGTPAAPTASAGTNTTQLATTAFVTTAIDVLKAEIATLKAQLISSGALSGQLLSSFTRSVGAGNCSWGQYETGYLPTTLSLKNDYYGASLLELSANLTNGQTTNVSFTAANTVNFASQVLYLSNLDYQMVNVQIAGAGTGFDKNSTDPYPNWATSFGPLQGKTITEIKLVPVSVSITNATSGNCDPYSYDLRWEFYGY